MDRDRFIEVVSDVIKDEVKDNRELTQDDIDNLSNRFGDSEGAIQELADSESEEEAADDESSNEQESER